ncbi:MAG: MFS transporter [Rhodospirillaceae bacterium]|nr:MFS transporter [Rhodospirillaceae bacterium]|tara:strand:+ start:14487 stop:15740 length:1254 start_codon:yes stop_codon:yes gene_type:complete
MRSYFSFIGQNAGFLSFGFLLAFLSSFGQTYFVALFGADIRNEYGLSHGHLGLIFSLATLASATCLLWAGRIIDRVDLRLYSFFVVLALAAACAIMASGRGIIVLFVAFFGLRFCGQGLMGHTSQTAMARYYDKGRGKALSIASLGHAFGQAFLPSLVIVMIAYSGWRGAWAWYAIILLAVMVPAVLFLLRGHQERHDRLMKRLDSQEAENSGEADGGAESTRQWQLNEVLRHPTFYFVMCSVIAPGMLMTGLLFHQIHMIETKSWDLTWFAACFSAFALFSVIFGIASGPIIDRYSARRLITWYLIPMGVGIMALVLSDHPLAVLVWFVLSGATSGLHRSVTSAFWAEAYGVRNLGAIRGFVSGISVFGTAISPVLFGQMIDVGISVELIAGLCVIWIVFAVPATWLGLRFLTRTN